VSDYILKIFCTFSIIAHACALTIAFCGWFELDVIHVTHLFEMTFDLTQVVTNNKSNTRRENQLDFGIKSKIEVSNLLVVLTMSNQSKVSLDVLS
jgi:methionyl-tRNA formyltransferase